jgi:hypothetical protein
VKRLQQARACARDRFGMVSATNATYRPLPDPEPGQKPIAGEVQNPEAALGGANG